MSIPANHPAILEAQRKGLIAPEPRPRKPTRGSSGGALPTAGCEWALSFSIPCAVVSEANRPSGEHWARKWKRKKQQREALSAALAATGLEAFKPPLPLRATFTRHGGRKMDDDNLVRAFKALRDALAQWIGVDDGDERIEWKCKQAAGKRAGVSIEIRSL